MKKVSVISLIRRRIASTSGHVIIIEPNTPTAIPMSMLPQAQELGCALADEISLSVVQQVTEDEQLTLIERGDNILAAIQALFARGNKQDFGVDGRPKVSSINEISGLSVTADERDDFYEKYRLEEI